LAALCGLLALGCEKVVAATSSRMDILSDDAARDPTPTIDVGAMKPIARPAQAVARPVPRGNPLWAVPLSALTVTQERPIFSASRRPPPRAVAALPVEEAAAPPPPKSAEALPPLVLLGAVVGEGDAIAILLDRTDQKVIRLREGEARAGWSLTSVQSREVTFKRGDRSEVLALQRPDAPAATAGAPGPDAAPVGPAGRLTVPMVGNTSFAPFVPRSTPKNGESDGL
jgi:general secretion pathway protein N